MSTSPDELKSRFSLDGTIAFPRIQDSDFLPLGVRHVPRSYKIIRELFGHSRLDSDVSRFWIGAVTDPNPNYSMTSLREMLAERLDSWMELQKENWRALADGHGNPANYPSLNPKIVIPVFCNSEYDYWLCWNMERVSPGGEPEVVYFDLGMQIILGVFPDLIGVYELLSDGKLVEPLPLDANNKIKLTGFEVW